jgi:hypothetical protein
MLFKTKKKLFFFNLPCCLNKKKPLNGGFIQSLIFGFIFNSIIWFLIYFYEVFEGRSCLLDFTELVSIFLVLVFQLFGLILIIAFLIDNTTAINKIPKNSFIFYFIILFLLFGLTFAKFVFFLENLEVKISINFLILLAITSLLFLGLTYLVWNFYIISFFEWNYEQQVNEKSWILLILACSTSYNLTIFNYFLMLYFFG